jgi:hypothetical protein
MNNPNAGVVLSRHHVAHTQKIAPGREGDAQNGMELPAAPRRSTSSAARSMAGRLGDAAHHGANHSGARRPPLRMTKQRLRAGSMRPITKSSERCHSRTWRKVMMPNSDQCNCCCFSIWDGLCSCNLHVVTFITREWISPFIYREARVSFAHSLIDVDRRVTIKCRWSANRHRRSRRNC